jgi:hypothetical protein
VREGVSGHICRSVVQMAKCTRDLNFNPVALRQYVADNFSTERMAKEYAGVYETALHEAQARRVA